MFAVPAFFHLTIFAVVDVGFATATLFKTVFTFEGVLMKSAICRALL
jgi:hypothetical protein